MKVDENFSILKLNETLRFALVEDFVKDKEDMLRQEKQPSQNIGDGFMKYINPKTKDRILITPYIIVYLGNSERKFNLNNHTHAMLKKVFKIQFTYRKLMIAQFDEKYKLGLDKHLVLENKKYLEKEEAKVREKLAEYISDEEAREIKLDFLNTIKTEQAKLASLREDFGITKEQ